VSAANLSTKAKIDFVGSVVPTFSEEVISSKNPRNWNDLPEHILLKIFETLTKDNDDGRQWVSRAGRVCKAWRRVSKDLLLGDTAASRPKRVQIIESEVHDNKTTLATKGDLVEESVANSASEVEACSKRQRLDGPSSPLHFPAFSDASLKHHPVEEVQGTEVGSLVSHLMRQGSEPTHNQEVIMNQNNQQNAITNTNNNGSVGQVQQNQPQISVDTGEAQRSGMAQVVDNMVEDGPCPSSNEGKCRSSYLGGVNFYVNSIVKNCLGSSIMQTTSTET